MGSAEDYREFYNRLGREYEETLTVYSTRLGQIRYQRVMNELKPFARRRERMLDVGCNDGVYTIPFCLSGGMAHGLDISEALIAKARAKSLQAKTSATFDVADIEQYRPFPIYDIVLMSEILEHLRHPKDAVRNAVSGVRPGGYFLLTTPLPYTGFRTYLRRLVARRPLTEPTEFEKFGVRYRHDGYYPLALKDWLESFGLKCVKATTMARELSRNSPFLLLLGCSNLQLHRRLL